MNQKHIEALSVFAILIAIGCFGLKGDQISSAGELAKGDLSSLVLSSETNSLKCGIFVGNPPGVGITNRTILIRDGKVANRIAFAILNVSTNKVNFYWPKLEQCLELELMDINGKSVPKTALGKKFGEPLNTSKDVSILNRQKYGLDQMFLPAKGDLIYAMRGFDIEKTLTGCFELKKVGEYKLRLSMRAYVVVFDGTGYLLMPTAFSPVMVDVRVEGQMK